MKYFLRVTALFALLAFPSVADAACGGGASNCFVTPAGGTWASGTFSATTGGASCACTPAATDTLILDSAAGNLTSVVGNPTLAGLDASGTGGSGSPYTNTFTHSAAQTISIGGNTFILSSGMTYTITTTSIIKFASTSGTTAITTNGKILPQLTFDGVGGTFQFQDNLTNNGNTISLVNGALDANSKMVNTGGLASSFATTRSITCGTANWTLTPSIGTSAWDLTTGTNLTVSCASATLNVVQTNSSATSGIAFVYGGTGCTGCNSYGTINVGALNTNLTQTVGFIFTGTVTWTVAGLNITAPNIIRFPNSAMTITNAVNWTGSAANPIFVAWSAAGGTSFNSVTIANSTVDWVVFRGIRWVTGTMTANDCLAFGDRTNLTCNVPSGGGGGGSHYIGSGI